DQFGDVVLSLLCQEAGSGELPEIARPQTVDGALNLPTPSVVACPRQIPVAQLVIELMQVVRGCDGGLQEVSPLVEPEILVQPKQLAGAVYELPHAGRTRVRVRLCREAALDHRQIDRIFGNTLFDEDWLDHRDVAPRAAHPLAEPFSPR